MNGFTVGQAVECTSWDGYYNHGAVVVAVTPKTVVVEYPLGGELQRAKYTARKGGGFYKAGTPDRWHQAIVPIR